MSTKVLWKTVRKTTWAWQHVQTVLKGDHDLVRCRRCRSEVGLENQYRTKASVTLEFARKHFYKCVVGSTLLPDPVANAVTLPEPELFHGQV